MNNEQTIELLKQLTKQLNDLATVCGNLRDIMAREVDRGACSAPGQWTFKDEAEAEAMGMQRVLGHPVVLVGGEQVADRDRLIAEASQKLAEDRWVDIGPDWFGKK